MTHEHAPEREQSLVGDESERRPWEVARERLANPEHQRDQSRSRLPIGLLAIAPTALIALRSRCLQKGG